MTDQTVGYHRPRVAARLADGGCAPAGRISDRVALVASTFLMLYTSIHFWRTEGTPINVFFTVATTLLLVAALTLASRRVLFSTVLTIAFVGLISATASIKRQIMNMVVHAYDIFFYLSSWSTISFLWSDHRRLVVGFALAVLAVGVLGWLAFRIDGSRIPRRYAAVAVALAIALTSSGALLKEERRHMQFYFQNLYVSSFYTSWAETAETLWRGQLVEAAPRASGKPFAIPATCETRTKRPHVILIHQESVVPPALFPTLDYDRRLDQLFKSFDGRLHKMRVETYGGASWLTEFSLLTGLSTHSFGGMRQFVQTVMEQRVRDTLPEALARCGYRNVVFYPMLKNFVSNARFYQSVGLKEIFDLKDQGATSTNERDRFYYGNALNEMERHIRSSTKPLFTYIQTMAAHWPYDITYMPEENVAGGGNGTHPEMHEYLRRVSMAKIDYDYLKAELARRFPNEPVVIVHYGDHQPTATRMLLGFNEETDAEDVVAQADSPAFITYYAVDAINWLPPALPAHEVVDIPYLGQILLEAAGLPLSDAMVERKRLLGVCNGRYYSCADRGQVLAFHRRLIDSKLMDAR